MATTSIWRVKGWLGKVVIYAENPEKTANPKFYADRELTEHDGQQLSDVIRYAVNSEKTQKTDSEDGTPLHRFVSGINGSPNTARDEMLAVKKRFGKEDGTVAYHGYQSFAPGEATPELAHEIGVKLATQLWGDRYQVIVATHLDKENHLHNHFVLNTVSFADGIKYHRTKKDYHEMQTVSDALCREYGLSVIEHAVKTTTDPDDPQEVATVDDSKKAILKDIFWQMNEISSRTESKTEEVITETDDGHGNIVETTTTVTRTYLYITVSHKTAEEMADHFNFTADQRKQLSELLAEENRRLWSAVLYGIYSGDDAIVKVALSQVGNVGGEPYWSWYGFESRVEWCACFVSWCFNECGYLDTGTAPKFAGCVGGVEWFRSREQWADNSINPSPGMIVFFDWNDPNGASGPQDGEADHVGIVEKCENGIVYTIEGNSGDACRQNQYPVGYYEILGYGILNP